MICPHFSNKMVTTNLWIELDGMELWYPTPRHNPHSSLRTEYSPQQRNNNSICTLYIISVRHFFCWQFQFHGHFIALSKGISNLKKLSGSDISRIIRLQILEYHVVKFNIFSKYSRVTYQLNAYGNTELKYQINFHKY